MKKFKDRVVIYQKMFSSHLPTYFHMFECVIPSGLYFTSHLKLAEDFCLEYQYLIQEKTKGCFLLEKRMFFFIGACLPNQQ